MGLLCMHVLLCLFSRRGNTRNLWRCSLHSIPSARRASRQPVGRRNGLPIRKGLLLRDWVLCGGDRRSLVTWCGECDPRQDERHPLPARAVEVERTRHCSPHLFLAGRTWSFHTSSRRLHTKRQSSKSGRVLSKQRLGLTERRRKKRCVYIACLETTRTRPEDPSNARHAHPRTEIKLGRRVRRAPATTSQSHPSPRPRRRRPTPFSSPCCAAHGGEPDPGDPHRTGSAGRSRCASGCPSGRGSWAR